jgi:hypothetical protein
VADLSRQELRQLARLGAKARLEELRQEEAAIRRAFPDLFGARAGRQSSADSGTGGRRRRRGMSAAARKAVSERMTRYWAEQRKIKKSKKKSG